MDKYNITVQYNKCSTGRLCITTSLDIWGNSYEEKAQLNNCDLSARLQAG